MIIYDSQNRLSLFKWSGSVRPNASKYALMSASLAVGLKIIEKSGAIQIHGSSLVTNNAAFGMYASTLAFLLVFRTSKCYSRFWHCATSCCTLRAQLMEAASGLISFAQMSNAPESDVEHFQKMVVSLVSLVHAAAMGNVCNRDLEDFEVMNWNALDVKHRTLLKRHTIRDRVELAYMWINGEVIGAIKSGLLNIPAPILSRVFQQLEKAMVEYNQVLEVMTIPFPFPYAQTAYLLLILLGFFTPFAMCSWTNHVVSCGCLSFIAVLCLCSLELIASELENPFGTDANDLPVESFQDAINESLALVVGSAAKQKPQYHFEDPQCEETVLSIAGDEEKVVRGTMMEILDAQLSAWPTKSCAERSAWLVEAKRKVSRVYPTVLPDSNATSASTSAASTESAVSGTSDASTV
jgi:putative membrane protein